MSSSSQRNDVFDPMMEVDRSTPGTSTAAVRNHPANDPDEDWEEWDGNSPFWIHCIAGSVAGVTEHTLLFPLDTVRTHIQVCAACLHRGAGGGGSSSGGGSAAWQSTGVSTPSSIAESASSLLRHSRMAKPSAHGGSVVAAATTTSTSTATAAGHLPVGMWQTIRYIMSEPASISTISSSGVEHAATSTTTIVPNSTWQLVQGWKNLWRGVQAIMVGCVPAHALYFSAYEIVKATTSTSVTNPVTGDVHLVPTTWGSGAAGAAAVTCHDLIMTPLDTIKQRMQLGHYEGSLQVAFASVLRHEGWGAFYRSFPVTLASNIPYGAVMVSTNEYMKQMLSDPSRPGWQTVMMSSSLAGALASAVTTPLDRVKTALQTQELEPACAARRMGRRTNGSVCQRVVHESWYQAARSIYQQEGAGGFLRGFGPRVLSHTPAVAISWTTYEMTKQMLMREFL